MILVDTSVLIDFLRGKTNDKITFFQQILLKDIPFGISCYTYQEILQGAKDKKEWEKLKSYLSTQTIYFLSETADLYEKAAFMFFNLRRKGVTPRSTIDMLIALIAIENNLELLHNDHDFDAMAVHVPELRILQLLL
ncbi:MAG: Ribonuclease VapC11 [Candidatus Dichloromethanomonas elyunquensis]|nr:MAG: Ribonuclease VapC11 [Candidatus Dichloromethanomonas elyunquensis]